MPVRTALLSIFIASLLIGGNALRPESAGAAQTSAPPPLPEVTVTAPRPPTKEELAGDAVANFVHVHAAPTVVTGQIARWGGGIGRGEGICPITIGLSSRLNDFVSARILAVAASVGAPVQTGGGCSRHNVYIVFATDPQKALDEMVKRDSSILGFHYPQQTRDLERISRPIQGWYVTSTRGVHGDESVDEANPLLPLESKVLNQGKHPAGIPGSRLSSGISSAIVNVVIVADVNKIVGRPIGAIADYLAMLTLTQAFASDQCGALPSILDMMKPNCGEREELTGVTAGDLGFLRALYKADLEEVLPLERGSIEGSMTRQFEQH
jgi:hypothetical protein